MCPTGSLDAGDGIFYHDAALSRDAKLFRRQEKNGGVRLAWQITGRDQGIATPISTMTSANTPALSATPRCRPMVSRRARDVARARGVGLDVQRRRSRRRDRGCHRA